MPELGFAFVEGESGVGADCCRSGRVALRFGRGVEQISQDVREGWFRKVQAGQAISVGAGVADGVRAGDSVEAAAATGVTSMGVDVEDERKPSSDPLCIGAGDAVRVTGVDIDRAVAKPTPHSPHFAPAVPFKPFTALTNPHTPHVQLVSA